MDVAHGGYREGNPTYKLTPRERRFLAILGHMDLWTKTALGEAFGVSRRTVNDAMDTYPKETLWT